MPLLHVSLLAALFEEFIAIPAVLIAFGALHVTEEVWKRLQQYQQQSEDDNGSKSNDNNNNTSHNNNHNSNGNSKQSAVVPFESTLLYGMAHSMAVSARVYVGLLFCHVVFDRFPALTKLPLAATTADGATAAAAAAVVHVPNMREAAPSAAMAVWVGMTVCIVKRLILWQWIAGSTGSGGHPQKNPHKHGRVAFVDRITDFVIFFVTVLSVLDQLQVDMTVGLNYVLSAGGIGALVFSLASKGLAEQIVGGFALNAWDGFKVGDKVRLQDGTTGYIRDIGLVDTQIQGFDNVIQRIPNAQLSFARVCNMSRVSQSRLKQYLRFRYADLDKLPAVLEEIKLEIRRSCPKLISPGKSFHAVLREYKSDHIEGMVLAHFDIPPLTAAFTNNRHDFVLAIARAMQRHKVAFALPTMVYHQAGDDNDDDDTNNTTNGRDTSIHHPMSNGTSAAASSAQ